MNTDDNLKSIVTALRKLEKRISRIEAHLDIASADQDLRDDDVRLHTGFNSQNQDALELNIGQFWFAKVGMLILILGIGFLLIYPYKNILSIVPAMSGYALAVVMLVFSGLWNKSFAHYSNYFRHGGLVLLYFSTLRLYYFGHLQQALQSKPIELLLLTTVVLITLIIAVRRQSPFLMGLGFCFGYCTAFVGEAPWLFLIYVAVLDILAIYFILKYDWPKLLIYSLVLTYSIYLIWFTIYLPKGNAYNFSLIFLLSSFFIFSVGNLFRKNTASENVTVIIGSLINSGIGYVLFLAITLTSPKSQIFVAHIGATFVFLALSIAFWIKEQSKYSTFFYAMTGYAALTVAIIARFSAPDFFIYLSWQSLLVVSTALWFRSKFIIIANSIIYIFILLAYLFLSKEVNAISISFGIVALISARILNWQKTRLELKSELIRNVYLAAAFFIFPYTFYRILPMGYVSLSWTGLSIFYYIVSVILKNKKYRWMALLNLLLTVVYVLTSDLIRLEPVYRILSFIILGVVLLALSLIYSRFRLKSGQKEQQINRNTQ